MTKHNNKTSKKAGLAPGTLVYIGKARTSKVKISTINYDKNKFEEKINENVEDVFKYKDKPGISWINVDGIHDLDVIKKIGKNFNLHPLIQEDIVNTSQRPKSEDFGDYIFVVLKMLYRDEKKQKINIEQISLIIGPNYVVSFQEIEGDIFNPIRERIKDPKRKIRERGSDYLAYSLIDSIVDNYFSILEIIGEKIESIEGKVIKNPSIETLQLINSLKREIIFLRKSVWPLRELLSSLSRSESKLIRKETEIYFRDVYDHTIQVIDTIETSRDMLSGMLDIYLSSISNKMNEVMKVLTIFASIFIPLTFVVGVYGMNFDFMPELQWKYSYFILLGIMFFIGIGMFLYFKRKKWV
jgi:magnesium transporter